jgi:hypothetical protein
MWIHLWTSRIIIFPVISFKKLLFQQSVKVTFSRKPLADIRTRELDPNNFHTTDSI